MRGTKRGFGRAGSTAAERADLRPSRRRARPSALAQRRLRGSSELARSAALLERALDERVGDWPVSVAGRRRRLIDAVAGAIAGPGVAPMSRARFDLARAARVARLDQLHVLARPLRLRRQHIVRRQEARVDARLHVGHLRIRRAASDSLEHRARISRAVTSAQYARVDLEPQVLRRPRADRRVGRASSARAASTSASDAAAV